MNEFVLLALFSGFAVAASLFAALYFLFVKNHQKTFLCLGLLFLGLTFRIGKSIFYYLLLGMSDIGTAIGFLGLSFIGPTTLLYIQFSLENKKSFQKTDLLHLIFPTIGFFITWFSLFSLVPYHTYWMGNFTSIAYLIVAFLIQFKSPKQANKNYWILTLIGGIILCLMYQLLGNTLLDYAYGAAWAALLVYALVILILAESKPNKKKLVIDLPDSLINKIIKSLEEEKYFLQQGLNLNQFSQAIQEPSYKVSKVVKEYYGRNFPEVINAMRIEEVKQRLSQDVNSKVEALAYDVGFNTPSAFYAAFKKETSSSPREYQKTILGG